MNPMAIGAKSAATDTAITLPTAGNSVATKENFLQLLVAQIKHQNPLSPADSTQPRKTSAVPCAPRPTGALRNSHCLI